MARTQSADYDARRLHILDQAATLFARQGFKETSVAQIAVLADVSKSLIYHYFPSKEDILFGAMSSHVDELLADAAEVLASTDEPSEQLARLLRRYTEHYAAAGTRQKVLLNELRSLPLEQRAEIVRKQREIVERVQALVVALDPALRRKPAKAKVKTMLLLGMINWMHTWYNPSGPITTAEVADLAFELVQAS